MKYLQIGKRTKLSEPRLVQKHRAARAAGMRQNRSEDGRTRNELYKTRQWSQLRKQVLAEEPLCRECRANGIATRATTVDHIRHGADWRALFFERSNLRALCGPCHNAKSGKDRAKARKASLAENAKLALRAST